MSRVTRHLTPATAIAFLALVFAITGGAFAATGGGNRSHATLTAQTAKSKGSRGPRGPRGATGPAGKNGTNGAPGAQGAAGAKGETGATGATGPQGLTGKEGEPGEPGEPGEAGRAGEEGSPWTDGGTLPENATETGTWSIKFAPATEESYAETLFSFPIPLAAPATPGKAAQEEYVTLADQTGHKVPAVCTVKVTKEGKEEEVIGSAEHPVAQPGYFCIYAGVVHAPAGREPVVIGSAPPGATELGKGPGTAGAIATVEYPEGMEEKPAEVYGSWAVTGAKP